MHNNLYSGGYFAKGTLICYYTEKKEEPCDKWIPIKKPTIEKPVKIAEYTAASGNGWTQSWDQDKGPIPPGKYTMPAKAMVPGGKLGHWKWLINGQRSPGHDPFRIHGWFRTSPYYKTGSEGCITISDKQTIDLHDKIVATIKKVKSSYQSATVMSDYSHGTEVNYQGVFPDWLYYPIWSF